MVKGSENLEGILNSGKEQENRSRKSYSHLYNQNAGKKIKVLNQYTYEKETVTLNLYQRVLLALNRPVKESVRHYKGWGEAGIPFYVFKYKADGETFLMLDYMHGYDDHFHTTYRGAKKRDVDEIINEGHFYKGSPKESENHML